MPTTETQARQETRFAVEAIDAHRLDTIRAEGADEFGNPLARRTAEGWEPLRCCLRKSREGEAIALICHTPWTERSPWQEAGPVFVHFGHCDGYRTPEQYPPEFANSPAMFNTFHADGSRAYAHIRFVSPGEDHEATLRAVLAEDDVDHVHVRSSTAGCFTFAARRS